MHLTIIEGNFLSPSTYWNIGSIRSRKEFPNEFVSRPQVISLKDG